MQEKTDDGSGQQLRMRHWSWWQLAGQQGGGAHGEWQCGNFATTNITRPTLASAKQYCLAAVSRAFVVVRCSLFVRVANLIFCCFPHLPLIRQYASVRCLHVPCGSILLLI